jgi:excisionase family DNA binding protein
MCRADSAEHATATEPLTYTVPEAAALLQISRNSAYEAVRVGQMPALRFGRRIVVPRVQLDRMLAGEGADV